LKSREAGVTLIETVVSLMIVVIGLAGLFASSAQSFALLRRSKEMVAAREDLLCRLDSIRALSYAQIAKSSYLTANLMESGTAGDPTPFRVTTDGMKNFSETVTVYGLGSQVFSNDTARQNATPDWTGQYASQLDTAAPGTPTTYLSNSTTKGDWTHQIAGALPYIQITRVGTGADAQVTVNSAGDLTLYPSSVAGVKELRIVSQLLVDVAYTWTDSNNVSRTQVASMIVSKTGSLQ
jgi:Tfp pilus assembly protein PilV